MREHFQRKGARLPGKPKTNAPPPHEPLGTSNIQHPTPNRQSMAQLETIGCSMLDVGCWMFSFGSGVQSAKFSGNSPPDRGTREKRFGEGRRRYYLMSVLAEIT